MSFLDQFFTNSQNGSTKKALTLTYQEIKNLAVKNLQFVDVRAAYERQSGHIPHDKNIPITVLSEKAASELPKDKIILTYCFSGHRSGIAAQLLRQMGYEAYSVAGGFTQWVSDGGDMVLPK